MLVVQWTIPLLVLGLIGYGFTTADAEVSWQMVKIWVLANGILAAVGAALALAHPLTILTAFLAAPLTSLNPLVAAGWVAGLCEALVHKPKVRDFEALPTDITTFKGFWRNGGFLFSAPIARRSPGSIKRICSLSPGSMDNRRWNLF